VADQPTFSDYMKAARQAVGTPAPATKATAGKAPKLSSFGSAGAGGGAKAQSPLEWLTDIISRPLYAVTDTVKGAIDSQAAGQEAAKKGGNFLDVLGAEAGVVAKHNPLTGLLSTDKANKSTTSDLIEHGTDVIGKEVDPNYQDTPDNVNPILKGVAGFVGDVALDPTTYIPGAQLLKVGKIGLNAGKALTEGVRAGANVAKESLQEAAKSAAKGEKLASDLDKAAAKITPPDIESAADATAAKAVDLPELPTPALTPEEHATNTAQLLAKVAASKPGKAMASMAKQVSATEFKKAAKATVDTAKAEALPWEANAASRNWMQEAVDAYKSTAKETPLTSFPKVSVGGTDIPLPVALQRAVGGDQIAIEDLKHWHETKYTPLFKQAQSRGVLVGPLLNKIETKGPETVTAAKLSEMAEDANDSQAEFERLRDDPQYLAERHAEALADQQMSTGTVGQAERAITPESLLAEAQAEAERSAAAYNAVKAGNSTPVQTIVTAMSNFERTKAENADKLAAAFGPRLVKILSQYKNEAGYTKAISDIRGVLDGSIDVTAIKRLTPPMQRALEHLGVDTAQLPVGMRYARPTASLEPAPTTMEKYAQQLDKMKGQGVDISTELAVTGSNNAVLRDLIEGEKLPFESATGTKRSAAEFGEGFGRNLREANTYYQWNMLKPMFGKLKAYAEGAGVQFGKARSIYYSQHIRAALRKLESFYDEQGIPMTVGVGVDRVPLGQSQIYDILASTNKEATYPTLWNGGTSVPPTNLLDAIHSAVTRGKPEEVEAMLRQTTTRHIRQDGRSVEIPNNLVKGGRFGRVMLDGDALVASLRDTIMQSIPKLRKAAEENAAAYRARGIAETNEMTDVHLKYLQDTYENGTISDMLAAIDGTETRVKELSKQVGATQLGREGTEVLTKTMVPAEDMVKAKRAVKTSKTGVDVSRETKGTPVAVLDKAQEASKAHEQEAFDSAQHDAAQFVAGGPVVDFGEVIDQGMGRGLFDKVRPIVDRKFGNELIHEDFVRSETAFKNLVGETAGRLNDIARKLPDPAQQKALMANVMAGVKNASPALQPIQDELADIVSQMIGTGVRPAGSRSLLDNAFFRNNTAVHHINTVFEKYGLDDKLFDADAAATAAKQNGTSIMEEAAKQSYDWEWNDPLAELNKMYTAFVTTQTHQTLAQKFVNMAKDMGATSHAPKPGYSLVGNDSGKSIFSRYMPDNVYFRDDILRQMHVVDTLSRQSMELNGPLGHFIKSYFMPMQNAWKYGMTLINPTHHIRNLISDSSLTFYQQGTKNFTPSWHAALQAMATRNGYSNWDAIAALQGAELLPSGGKAVVKGKLGELNARALHDAFANRGNLPGFKQLEQLDEHDSGSKLADTWEKITQSKGARTIGGVSEARDHFSRLQHAAQFVMNNIDNTSKYKSMDELLDAASAEARKWHPDGSDMTRSEQYFRLLIPFYSWQRKSIPLIAETLLTNPARLNALPKASYAVAVGMGVHPDSLSDPFPQDQMFPSYITNQLTGPQFKIDGKYYGVNPGFAGNDTLNTYLGDNPLRSILGQVTPLVKAPFELAAGGNVGTGGRINDTSDYVDSQIPVVAPISRITGDSVTGTLLNAISGNGKGLDPNYQIAAGNKDQGQNAVIALTNWLTGAGISPMSLPNQINYAEIEKRNAAGGK
jgi:hypothetical protein